VFLPSSRFAFKPGEGGGGRFGGGREEDLPLLNIFKVNVIFFE
jgi:hypothetical protein